MIAHTLYLLSGPIRFAASDDDAKRLGQEIRDQTEELARLRAEVERLRAENAALAGERLAERLKEAEAAAQAGRVEMLTALEKVRRDVGSLVQERDALRAEVERLRRMSEDASRYRWLRDWLRKVGLLEYIKAAHRPDGTHGPATVLRRPDVINGSELVGWSAGVGQGFDDAAIDAARAAQEGKT